MTTSSNQIKPGDVVWAVEGHGPEIRYRVVDVEADSLWLKRPGSDAGLFSFPTAKAIKSTREPSTIEEAQQS